MQPVVAWQSSRLSSKLSDLLLRQGLLPAGAASVMAPAVANPGLMGYKALYKTMLEDSKRGLARAMRVFASEDNYPILVHCIHGKDRTGIVIALLLMLCDVDAAVRLLPPSHGKAGSNKLYITTSCTSDKGWLSVQRPQHLLKCEECMLGPLPEHPTWAVFAMLPGMLSRIRSAGDN